MIPKVIHYCWFSGEEKTELVKKCMDTWRKKMPDYEIKEWNCDNFDFSINSFAREAIECKKWAFASDFVRLYVLYNEGGIYLDSDIEVLKNFDDLLDCDGFTGLESKGVITAWLFGSKKGNPLIKEFLDYYEDKHFINKNKMMTIPNTVPLSEICKKYGLKNDDVLYKLENMTIYPTDFFCGKSIVDGKIRLTNNTYTIHHFEGGWQSRKERFIRTLKYKMFCLFGNRMYPFVRSFYIKYFKK